MATISSSIVSASATAAVTATAADPLTIGVNAIIVTTSTSTDAYAILADESNSTVTVLGDLRSEHTDAVHLDGTNMRLTIGAKSSIFGDDNGVRTESSHNTIVNAGEILSLRGAGVSFHDGDNNTLSNSGSIRSLTGNGVFFDDDEKNVLVNTGLIESLDFDGYGVRFWVGGSATNRGTIVGDVGVGAGGALILNNFGGTIGDAGTVEGVKGSLEADRVTNTGVIRGSVDAVFLDDGNDIYNGSGGRLFGQVDGGRGNDTLTGGAFADVLFGGEQNDTLAGGGGVDTLNGGSGDDIYQLGADALDSIADSSGTDLIYSTITRNLTSYAPIERLTLQGTANINGTGNILNNIITGNAGKNTLVGGDGNDELNGGPGLDVLNGGNGNDYFMLGAENDTVIDNGTGISSDTIFSSISRSLAGYATIEGLQLQGTANISATGNDLNNGLGGNGGNNALKGGIGNDTLAGTAGADSLYGGVGNDTFLYLLVTDSVANPSLRDVIYDFEDNGDNDTIGLNLVPGIDNINQITLTQAGANVVVSINVGMQILVANTTIGGGAGQIDLGDFVF